MEPSTLLSQLRDAHAPEPISFWPIAPGWWILLIVILLIISVGAYFLISWWKANTWKRQATKRFTQLREQYLASPSLENIIEINKLLKQTISSCQGNRRFLPMHGKDWEEVLLSVNRKNKTVLSDTEVQILSHAIYTENLPKLDNDMLDRISLWIRYVK